MASDLDNEWARMNRMGAAANRKKALATLASVGVVLLIIVPGYAVILMMSRVPVLFLALPWIPALAAGWWVRNRLWPSGQLGR